MSRPIPPKGSVADWLRQEASQPFVQGRAGDEDDIPLGWLPEVIDTDPRILDAIVVLLAEGDPVVTSRLLTAAASSKATPLFRGAVARAIGKSATTLSRTNAASDQSALGMAVYAIWPPPPLSDDTILALSRISRPEDGWPLSLRTVIVVDFPRVADSVASSFERMSDEEQRYVLLGLLQRAAPSTLNDLFDRIGRDGSQSLRARVSAALKRTLDELDDARRFAAASGVNMSGETGAARWQRYAPLLRNP